MREHQYGGQVTHVAMETKELDTLKLLLDSGCDPNATRSSDGVCLLKLAIEHRFTEGVQLLLQYGARCHPGKLKDGRLSREPLVAMATNKWGMCIQCTCPIMWQVVVWNLYKPYICPLSSIHCVWFSLMGMVVSIVLEWSQWGARAFTQIESRLSGQFEMGRWRGDM